MVGPPLILSPQQYCGKVFKGSHSCFLLNDALTDKGKVLLLLLLLLSYNDCAAVMITASNFYLPSEGFFPFPQLHAISPNSYFPTEPEFEQFSIFSRMGTPKTQF